MCKKPNEIHGDEHEYVGRGEYRVEMKECEGVCAREVTSESDG